MFGLALHPFIPVTRVDLALMKEGFLGTRFHALYIGNPTHTTYGPFSVHLPYISRDVGSRMSPKAPSSFARVQGRAVPEDLLFGLFVCAKIGF